MGASAQYGKGDLRRKALHANTRAELLVRNYRINNRQTWLRRADVTDTTANAGAGPLPAGDGLAGQHADSVRRTEKCQLRATARLVLAARVLVCVVWSAIQRVVRWCFPGTGTRVDFGNDGDA